MNGGKLKLDVISLTRLEEQLREANQRACAEQNFLLCQAALQRRRVELDECIKLGKRNDRLERIIRGLEASLQYHASCLKQP